MTASSVHGTSLAQSHSRSGVGIEERSLTGRSRGPRDEAPGAAAYLHPAVAYRGNTPEGVVHSLQKERKRKEEKDKDTSVGQGRKRRSSLP